MTRFDFEFYPLANMADTLDGGTGDDIARYQESTAGVTIDPSATPDANGYVRGRGGYAEGDKLKNIRKLYVGPTPLNHSIA